MQKTKRINHGEMRPGQDLVVVGYVGLKGTRLLARERAAALGCWFLEAYMEEARQISVHTITPDIVLSETLGVTEYEEVGEGGILTALWNLSGGHGRGISFTLRKIPLLQVTIEICERFGLNPYRLMSDNCLVLVAENGFQTVERLKQSGIFAVVIGYVNKGIKREILREDGQGFLDRPQKDELWKVLTEHSPDRGLDTYHTGGSDVERKDFDSDRT